MAHHDAYIKNALSKYKFPELARPDIQKVFRIYPDLKPKLDQFVFNDGSSKDLLNLEGTVPVNYKGSIYNIPIIVWLLDSHPYNPPLMYVKPTNTMRIKPGPCVDTNGKINLPYTRDWQHPRCNLIGLLQVIVVVFGEQPPVYTIQTPPARPPYPPQPQGPTPYPGQSQPPYPVQGQTPYPTNSGYMPMPTPSNQPYPYMPPSTTTQPPYPVYNNQSRPNVPQPYPQNTPYYPTGGPSYTGQSTTSYGAYPGQYTPAQPTYAQPTNAAPMSGTSTITEEHLRASLLSAVEDKLRRRLKETFDTAQAEMDVLYKTQRDLQSGKDQLETMVKDLEKEKGDVEQKIELITQKDREIKAALSRMQNQDKVPIDDAVVTIAPLYKQLLNSFSEEQAVEDAIYYLGEALRRDVIDLDVFLKQVRELSRRQFMLRALIQKCREKAGLPGLS